ncbi:RHS repeat-associated core domain-containing protein [Hafnia alvei]|uniref:RHS repeat-associated core domain-containing protein n=1 Tax=Hafnia alvei TaxID=569 RepID=UPI001412DD1C|nr:RHS repeat-associated core domain-containing protein [Hafnia alvei]QIP54874.1 hypothetical protein HBA19_04210 [Hafnia alvei]
MAGLPAARQTDETTLGGPITQGSLGVLIGAPSGVACSTCPNGIASAPPKGKPINPTLGAKVLYAETDFALPAAVPFILSRSYSSYQTDTPAPVGLLGPGWQLPSGISLLVTKTGLILNDNGGRSLHFNPLAVGEAHFSRSESLWLVRGGLLERDKNHPLAMLWHTLPESWRLNSHLYFATADALGPWWVLGISEDEGHTALPAPLSARRFLRGMRDRFGQELQYFYEGTDLFAGVITEVEDSVGRRYRLEHQHIADAVCTQRGGWGRDNGVRLSAVYLMHDPDFPDVPAEPLVRYEYTPRGELQTVYDRSGQAIRQFAYHPELLGRMTAHRYLGRPVSQYTYDAQGRAVTQSNPNGLDYQFDYAADSTTVTDSLGRRETYYYTGEKGLKRVLKRTYADGSESHNEVAGYLLMAQTDALGRKTAFTHDITTSQLTSIVAPDGNRTRFGYNLHGLLTQTILPDDRRLTRSYDALGRLTAESDALNRTVRYAYADDASSQPCTITDAGGGEKRLTWTRSGQLSRYTDCSGNTTEYRYDRWGQRREICRPAGLTQRYEYDTRGRLISTENNAGERPQYHYNLAGDLVTLTEPDGSQTVMTYDDNGRLLTRTHGGATQQFAYDAADRLITLTNENDAQMRFSYDVMDRLVEEVGFDGRVQRYRYNAVGELIESDDAGLITQWQHDILGRLVSRAHAVSHDDEGKENAESTENEITRWEYNLDGQLMAAHHVSEGYPVSVLFERNLSGQINQEQQIVSAPDGSVLWQHRIQHRYDANSALLFTTPDGLPTLHWHTYGLGHLLGVALGEQSLLEFDRDTLHRETQRRFGESVLETSYTEVGRLHSLTLSTPNADPRAQEYCYTPRGQLSDIVSPYSSQHYEYDGAGRLIHERSAHRCADYHLDLAGNRLINHYMPEAFMADMRHPGNRLSEDAHFYYQYDSHGNLSQKTRKGDAGEVHHYRYDRSHRLVSYLCYQDGEALRGGRYCYDPLGRRIGKQLMQRNQPKHISWFGWDGDKLVLTERDGTRIHTVYLPHSFVPLLRFEGDKPPTVTPLADKLEQEVGITLPPDFKHTLHHIELALRANRLSEEQHAWLNQIQLSPDYLVTLLDPLPDTPYAAQLYDCNHLGTPQQLINLNGDIDWSITLDAWGNALSEENPHQLHQPIRMQGQQYDEESGLHYNRHRYYDPMIGRYITQDPIGLRGGLNYYVYPLDPLQQVDTLGLTLVSAVLPGLGATYLDDAFLPLVTKFIANAEKNGVHLHFNSAYRSPEHQSALHNDPNAITPADRSLHSCGFAVDVNYSSLPSSQQKIIREAAASAGLDWGGNFRTQDPPHFYNDPRKNRDMLIHKATQEYLRLTKQGN